MKAVTRYFRVVLLGAVLCCLAHEVSAQPRVGVVMTGDVPYYRAIHAAFVTGLEKQAARLGRPEIILQRPFPDSIAWSNAARKLIALDVDLIVTYGAPATRAVLEEKSKIPVVYAGVYDPENGSVVGRNLTGCGFRVPLSSFLRYFKRLRQIDSVAVVFSSLEEGAVRQYRELLTLAGRQGIRVTPVDIRRRRDVTKLRTITDGAVLLTGSALAHMWAGDILAVLEQKKIPAADVFPDDGEEGVLITLFSSPAAQGRKAAHMAARILRGEKIEDVAPEVLRETELVVNLQESSRLGVTVPVQLIVEATRVIR